MRAWIETATTETIVYPQNEKEAFKKFRKQTQWAQIGQLHAVRGTNLIIL